MFRPMRRMNRTISSEAITQLVEAARYGILSVHGEDGYPYAIPVNFLYEDGNIYFHGARAGHKADALASNDKVCFTVVGEELIRDEPWAPWTRSVVLFGRCRVISDPVRASDVCERFAAKYYPDMDLVRQEISASGKSVRMYEIEVEHTSGKEIQER